MALEAHNVLPPHDLVNLTALMGRTSGRAEIVIGLIDGPVAADHPDLAPSTIRQITTSPAAAGAAASHGTYVARILSARRGSVAPAICPGCTLLVRPIFLETHSGAAEMPSATPDELADAIAESADAGSRVLNLSVAVSQPSPNRERRLEQALDHAMHRGAIVVAAAGNQGTLGSSAITRHPWVIPVAACDARGWPLGISNLGGSIGRRGLLAPGDQITSLGTDGRPATSGGTSAAAPFVTGAIALLWSMFAGAGAAEVRSAVTRASARRAGVVPPLLNAWAAYQLIWSRSGRG